MQIFEKMRLLALLKDYKKTEIGSQSSKQADLQWEAANTLISGLTLDIRKFLKD